MKEFILTFFYSLTILVDPMKADSCISQCRKGWKLQERETLTRFFSFWNVTWILKTSQDESQLCTSLVICIFCWHCIKIAFQMYPYVSANVYISSLSSVRICTLKDWNTGLIWVYKYKICLCARVPQCNIFSATGVQITSHVHACILDWVVFCNLIMNNCSNIQ